MKRLTLIAAMTLAGSMSMANVPVMASARAPAAPARSSHTGCALPHSGPGASYHPKIDPKDFGPQVTNPWFPLKPGVTYIYAGTKDDLAAVNVVTPSSKTRVVDGVRTRVVNDRLYLNGVLSERTSDYYAQDRCGNVWYFGEDTATLDANGKLESRDGSFHAGVNGAQPGVYMQAHPTKGRMFRQEYSVGNAEDVFAVVGKNASITVPYGAFQHAIRSQEATILETEVLDNKFYVRGIGQVQELSVKGPVEKLSLVDVLR